MNNQTTDKKYVCAACGSEASAAAGDCCGADRQEKKTSETSQEHKTNSSCGCGC